MEFLFLFPPTWLKNPCRDSWTKEYSECCLSDYGVLKKIQCCPMVSKSMTMAQLDPRPPSQMNFVFCATLNFLNAPLLHGKQLSILNVQCYLRLFFLDK